MYRLEDKHLAKAKEIAVHNRKRKSCKDCYDRGYIGVTQENTLVICRKCVDIEQAYSDWKEYIREIPELHEYYEELLKSEEELNNV